MDRVIPITLGRDLEYARTLMGWFNGPGAQVVRFSEGGLVWDRV